MILIKNMLFINPNARSNQNIPNIGLAYVATHFNAKVIDLNTMPEPADRFLIHEEQVLGISIQSRTFSEAQKIAALYKEKYPKSQVKSVSGFLDVLCCYPYLDFEEKIEYKEPFSDSYPFPNYELFDSFRVFQKNWQKGEWAYAIMTSYGCPYQCVHCASKNRKWLPRSPENCYEELKQAKEKWKIKYFLIIDDCFNVDKERVFVFCRFAGKLNLKWSCTNGLRADRFDEEMALAMKKSGCWQISFGIESVDETVLKTIKKEESFEEIQKAVEIAKKYYPAENINGFFIIGLPGSDFEKDLKSIEWVKNEGIHAHFNFYVPFDKNMHYDKLFYGEHAVPLSDVYPRELQKKIYNMSLEFRKFRKQGVIKTAIRNLFLK
ncbi:MAG: radical SAM protein [Elusimicrobiota bacterium]